VTKNNRVRRAATQEQRACPDNVRLY